MFSEPEQGQVKVINSVPRNLNEQAIYFEIPINAPESILLSQIKDSLHSEFVKRGLDGKYLFPQDRNYKMQVSRNFQSLVWINRLKCIQLQEEGKSRLEIGEKLQIGGGEGENCLRQVSRYIQLGKKLLKNVEKGRFNVSFLKRR